MSSSPAFSAQDKHWMQHAIGLAQQAKLAGEVPVGAVLVLDNAAIAYGHNCPIATSDPTGHAEIMALRQAAEKARNYRLLNTTLYVTLEPCLMCVGAMVHARIKRLVYGAHDPKAGAVISRCQALDQAFLNHRVDHAGGLFSEESAALLGDFFRERR